MVLDSGRLGLDLEVEPSPNQASLKWMKCGGRRNSSSRRMTADFDPRGSRTKSPSSKSQLSGSWRVEKTQEMPKVKVEQFKENGNVDWEEKGDGLQ